MYKNKRILMACCNYWNSPFQVGSHHIAKGFLNLGCKTAFISDPISPLHMLTGMSNEFKERFQIYKQGGISDNTKLLWSYVPGALLTPHNKPILRTEYVQRHWADLTIPNVVTQTRKRGFEEVDLIYLDSVNQMFWLDKIKYKKAVLRIADKNSAFIKNSDMTKKLEHELVKKVDMVIYSAHNLKQYVEEMHPKNTLHLPNGVNFEHFTFADKSVPKEYKDIKRPIVLYVGAMDFWFDYELIQKTAKALPNMSFVFIGPDKMFREKVKPLPNIHVLGRKSYQDIPSYIHNADLGIIPFNTKSYPDLVNSIHPLKLYEYMACGLPVVSTEWDELRNISSPAILCKNSNEFIEAISCNVSKKEQDKEDYIKYAKQHKWSERVRYLLDILDI